MPRFKQTQYVTVEIPLAVEIVEASGAYKAAEAGRAKLPSDADAVNMVKSLDLPDGSDLVTWSDGFAKLRQEPIEPKLLPSS